MIRIDTYFDVTCDKCGRSWSTDFEMGMATNKEYLRRVAHAAGWRRNKNGKTITINYLRRFIGVKYMTAKEYIKLYQATGVKEWIETVFPSILNGEFTIDGKEWFPCVILKDDTSSEDTVYIVTRNQTFMHEQRNKVRVYENSLSIQRN